MTEPTHGAVVMLEPWMMLDVAGQPVPASVFDGDVCRVVGLDECRRLVADGRLPSDFLAGYRDGDTILWHTSPEADWEAYMGSEGYALIRNQYLVKSFVTKMN
jgi:hypothetical protein